MNIREFNFKEMFNNSKGKTSLALVLCGVFGVVSALCFLMCGVVVIVDSFNQVSAKTDINILSMQSVAIITLVMSYLSARRFSKDKDIEQDKSDTIASDIDKEAEELENTHKS